MHIKNFRSFIYEQFNFNAALESSGISLPETISGEYNGSTGDGLHAFQKGGLNKKVNERLKQLRAAGVRPDITDVKIEVIPSAINSSGHILSGTMKWWVTIDESKDGKSYRGITSCGSCCNSTASTRAIGQVGELKTWNSTPEKHALIADIDNTENGGKSTDSREGSGRITVKGKDGSIDGAKYLLRQLFYKYY